METQRKTLLGVLANRFPGQTENIATEALLHIVNSSRESKQAFIAFLKQTSCVVGDDLNFTSQAQSDEDSSIPDLIGTNSHGNRNVIVENKFWAGLTDNQPNTYISQLPDSGLLLFVAPSLRLPTVWAEIKRRVIENGYKLEQDRVITNDFIETKTEKAILAVTSWRCLLNFLCTRMTTAGDLDTVSDIKQLIGLCDEQDSDAFIPLRSEDLSPVIPTMILRYQALVDAIADNISKQKLIDMNKSSSSYYYYAKNGTKGNNGIYIQFNYYYWLRKCETPLWLLIQEISNGKWYNRLSQEQKTSLSVLEKSNPQKIFHLDYGACIPLFIPLHAEKDEVVRNVVLQIKEVLDLLP